MADGSGGRVYYASLDLAVAGWGKWLGAPWKLVDASRVLEMVIEIKGDPTAGDEPGASPFYARGQYVNVTWSGVMALQLQVGFIRTNVQLIPAWVADSGAPGSGDWFKMPFPDHLQPGKSLGAHTRSSQCTNGCSPGEQQPIGSVCPYCDEAIRNPLVGARCDDQFGLR